MANGRLKIKATILPRDGENAEWKSAASYPAFRLTPAFGIPRAGKALRTKFESSKYLLQVKSCRHYNTSFEMNEIVKGRDTMVQTTFLVARLLLTILNFMTRVLDQYCKAE